MSKEKPPIPPDPSPCPLPTTTSTNSFWHTEPSSLLTAHRSTRNLPQDADVVIIGSGITGASVAHHLLNDDSKTSPGREGRHTGRNAMSVVMLEAREACWGATGRNGGHCQPLLLEHPQDPSIAHFELRNFHALRALIAAKRIPCEFAAQPGVRAIYSPQNLLDAELALQHLQSTAPEIATLTRITRDEGELAALRVPGALGAVVTQVAGRMWPYKFVARILEDLLLASALPGGGFNLQTLTPVTGLARCRPSGPRAWQVSTPRGAIAASRVVLATNAYTSHLLPAFADLIVPVRGQMSALRPPPSLGGPGRLATSFGFAGDGRDDYLIQRPSEGGGELMFGGGRQCKPCVGEADDSEVDRATAKYLRGRLVEALGLKGDQGEEDQKRRARMRVCGYCQAGKIRCSIGVDYLSGFEPGCTNCIRFEQPHADGKPSQPSSSPHGKEPPELAATHEWTGIMGFSRDDLPWVGPVPASMLASQNGEVHREATDLGQLGRETGLYIAAGYTGHGMPNAWLCGAAISHLVSVAHRIDVDEAGIREEGASGKEETREGFDSLWTMTLQDLKSRLPERYLVTDERIATARELDGVAVRDWTEMERGARSERPASGYA